MLSNNRKSRTFTRSPLALAIGAVLAFASSAAIGQVVVDAPPDLTASKAFSTNGEATPHLRNASRTPSQASTKSKLEALPIYVAARKADGTLIEGAAKVHPMVITYTDRHESGLADDVLAAVSLDDGATWKHMNLSRSADKYTDYMVRKDDDVLSDGAKLQALGDVRKPSLKVDGNFILVSWTSKLCRSGDPTDIGDGADPFQVKGSQGGVDYGATYDRPDLGVVPFSCLWVARGMIEPDGAIKWFIPEQITSGRRDALQDVPFSAKDRGFALVWQEDPVGLDPGKAAGSGEGMSGATVNHKTDIWYTFITNDAFDDVESVDDEYAAEDGVGKLRPAVKFAHPVRLTDNMSCKVVSRDPDTNAPTVLGLPICEQEWQTYCPTDVPIVTGSGEASSFCKTSAGVVLDGDTGASRPNLFMFPTSSSALVGLGYEETKGVGEGNQEGQSEDDDPYAAGKLVRYHYFSDFTKPVVMQKGDILNRPAIDPITKTVMKWPDGSYKYENARRVRFILQGKSACGDAPQCTTMVAVFKQGIDGKGAESDVMMARAVNGYSFGDFVKDPLGSKLPAIQNVSSPTTIAGYADTENDGVLKPQFKWIADDLRTESWANRDDDARAQRGAIRGNTLLLGFTWTANQDAARNGNDKYDFFVRWSDDGGATWRTDRADPTALEVFNVSKLPNNKSTVIEPRTIGTPGSIFQADGTFYSPDDRQNPNVFHLAYGTSVNVDTNIGDDNDEDEGEAIPEDIYFVWTEDAGRTYKTVYNNNDGRPENGKLATRNDAAESEVQLRTVPSGLKLYAVWNHEGPVDSAGQPIDGTGPIEGSDVGFRKITNLPDLYDLNGDGKVDISDLIVIRAAMGKCEGKKGYNPVMDYDNDKCITLGDYAKFEEANRADD